MKHKINQLYKLFSSISVYFTRGSSAAISSLDYHLWSLDSLPWLIRFLFRFIAKYNISLLLLQRQISAIFAVECFMCCLLLTVSADDDDTLDKVSVKVRQGLWRRLNFCILTFISYFSHKSRCRSVIKPLKNDITLV